MEDGIGVMGEGGVDGRRRKLGGEGGRKGLVGLLGVGGEVRRYMNRMLRNRTK